MIQWLRRFRARSARHNVAIRINLEAGVLEECPVCRTIVDKQHKERLPIADQIAAQRVRANDPSVTVYRGDLEAIKKQLRKVRKDCPYLCVCEDAG